MPHHFYYLRGAFGVTGLLEAHQEAIDKVLTQGFSSKNIEKLKGYDIYSIRLGDAARLLFSTLKLGDNEFLLVLDYLPNHEYEKSKFLKYRVLERYRQQATELLAVSDWDDAKCVARFQALKPKTQNVVLDYFKGEYINLNAKQAEVLQLQLPAIVCGAAGSGKSCVALSLLRDYQAQHPDKRLLYISCSAKLVQERHTDWQQMANSQVLNTDFKTFENLIREHEEQIILFVGKELFLSWYVTYLKIQKLGDKSYESLDATEVYEEFRICSGYDEDIYLALGDSQTLIPRERRPEIYKAFLRYKAFLEKQQQIDDAFYQFKSILQPYDLIILDEAQDVSYGQAKQLFSMANNGQIVFCVDGHQRLNDRRSILPFLRNQFRIHDDSRCVILPQTYRCAPIITQVANELLAIKHKVLGGKVDKRDFSLLESNVDDMQYVGYANLGTPEELLSKTWAKQLVENAGVVVVTPKQFKNEVKELFGFSDAVIFTPAEIKGLESEIVLIWKLLDKEILKEIRAHLVNFTDSQEVIHQAKHISLHEGVIPFFNGLYTAYTRAKTRLIICEEQNRQTECVTQRLRLSCQSLSNDIQIAPSSEEEWLRIVKRFLIQQQPDRAKAIYLQKLGDAQAFAMFRQHLEEETTIPQITLKKEADLVPRVVERVPFDCIEKQHAELLYENFSIEQLDIAEKKCVLDKLFREPYLQEKGQWFPLIYYIQINKTKSEILFAWLVSNLTRIRDEKIYHILNDQGSNFIFRDSFIKQRILFNKVRKKFKSLREAEITEHGSELLLIAIRNNWFNEFNMLVSLGAHVHVLDSQGRNAAFLAILYEHEHFFSLLQTLKVNFDLPSHAALVPIHIAVRKGNLNHLVFLKKIGVNIFQQTYDGFNLAHFACMKGDIKVIDLLMRWGINFNHPNKDGITPVGLAVLNGNIALIEKLKSYELDFNHIDHNGENLIFYAMAKGHVRIMELLHSWGLSMNHITKDGSNLFHYAAAKNVVTVMDLLFRYEVDINHVNHAGMTPILKAIQRGFINSVVKLFKLGADLNFLYKNSWSLMHVAAEQDNVEMISLLYQLGLDLNIKNPEGIMPIHQAVQFGNVKAVMHFINLGVNPLIVADDGMTLVHLAAMFGHVNLLILFKEWGLDFNLKNKVGETPVFAAIQAGHLTVAKLMQEMKCNFHQIREDGVNLLQLAVFCGRLELIDFLIECGLNIHERNLVHHKGLTFYGLKTANTAIILKLIEYGLSFTEPDELGNCPVHEAAELGQLNVLLLFKKLNFDLDPLNHKNLSPLFLAAKAGHLEIVKMLLPLSAYTSYMLLTPKFLIDLGLKNLSILPFINAWLRKNNSTPDDLDINLKVYPHDIAEINGHLELSSFIKTHLPQERLSSLINLSLFNSNQQKDIKDLDLRPLANV